MTTQSEARQSLLSVFIKWGIPLSENFLDDLLAWHETHPVTVYPNGHVMNVTKKMRCEKHGVVDPVCSSCDPRVPTREDIEELVKMFGLSNKTQWKDDSKRLVDSIITLFSPPKQKVCETCGQELLERPKE